MNQIWKDVVGYEGLYEISHDKIVRNKKTLFELKQYIPKSRKSLNVALTKCGQTTSARVETIYTKTFGSKIVNFEGEKWVDIIGYEGVYEVSNFGRVRGLNRYIDQTDEDGNVYQRFIEGKLLSLNRTNGNGYHIVQLRNGCSDESIGNDYIHSLVAIHFIPNPMNKPTVNHKDGNKSNNHVDNLEWATQQEQMIHAYKNNLGNIVEKNYNSCKRGSENPLSKLNEEEAMEVYDLAHNGKYTQKEIGAMYDINRRTVEKIKYKKTWKHIHKNVV